MNGGGPPAGARVLVLGHSPEVLETVMQELAELGHSVRGTTEAEAAAERFDARDFELIAFGQGIAGPSRERLKRGFARQNPRVHLLDTHAPLAVRQIVGALAGMPQEAPVDVDAYCARLGYHGPRTATLRALHALHPAAITFEAIDVLLGRSVDLTPAAVDAKLIRANRGGYCYEQNGLFRRVLVTIGFEVESLLGRVRWLAPAGSPPRPRTHMALRVMVDGEPWSADVGFGSSVPTSPLRLDRSEPQPTAHEPFRVLPFGTASLLVQARRDGKWLSLYEVTLESQLDVDHELANWFTATHPGSLFRQHLVVARATPKARYTLLDGQLTVRRPTGEVERRRLGPEGIERALRETFGLPVEHAWRSLIERAAAATSHQ